MINFGGLFFSGQVDYVCARGWEGKGGGVHSEEPSGSKYDADSNWGEVWSELYLEEAGI